MKVRNMNVDDTARLVRELLESFFWLPGLKPNTRYARLHDDHDGKRDGYLSVIIGEDGDAWVNPVEPGRNGLRFRMPLHGGGASPRVRAALVILAEAIRLDNEELPIQSAAAIAANQLGSGPMRHPNDEFRWICPACNTVNSNDDTTCVACKKQRVIKEAGAAT